MEIVYIGNCLSRWGYTPTTIETISNRFNEFAVVHTYSDRRNPFARLLHMIYGIWINRQKADFVLIDTYSSSAFYFGWICSLICRSLKLPYVPFLHGGNLPNRLVNSPKLSSSYFGNAACLVAPSNYLFKQFEIAGFKNVVIIPNYIDIKNYKFKHRVTPQPRVLWVRSFHQTYNPNLAIDILLILKDKYPNAELCMVGPDKDGSLIKFIEYAKSKGVIESIKITGKLSKDEWIELSSSYDFFLNTTNFDNTPVSVMEAMALGLLVVSTNPGGVPSIITNKKNGFLFNCGNSVEGAELLINGIQSSNIQSISYEARKQSEEWDWQVVKSKWINLFSQIIESRQRG